MRYAALAVLILLTWFVGLVAEATAITLRARLAGREPGGISLLWYVVVVPVVVGVLIGGAYLLDRTHHNLGVIVVGGGAALLLAHATFRAVAGRRKLDSLDSSP